MCTGIHAIFTKTEIEKLRIHLSFLKKDSDGLNDIERQRKDKKRMFVTHITKLTP